MKAGSPAFVGVDEKSSQIHQSLGSAGFEGIKENAKKTRAETANKVSISVPNFFKTYFMLSPSWDNPMPGSASVMSDFSQMHLRPLSEGVCGFVLFFYGFRSSSNLSVHHNPASLLCTGVIHTIHSFLHRHFLTVRSRFFRFFPFCARQDFEALSLRNSRYD